MDVKLNNFVEININKHEYAVASGSRDTAVLLNVATVNNTIFEDDKVYEAEDYVSLYDAVEAEESSASTKAADVQLLKYFTYFFKNGGVKLHYIKYATNWSTTLAKISMEEIVIIANGLEDYSSSASSGTEKVLLNALTGTGIEQKIFVGRIPTTATLASYTGYADKEFYVQKYGEAGIEATVAAYLTQIGLDDIDSAKDYAFTKEEVEDADVFGDEVIKYITKEGHNFNANCKLVGDIRAIGGNDTAGFALTNQFMLVCLYQTLTERLVRVLKTKVRYDNDGIAKVLGAINAEIKRYVNNGYITLNKIYRDTNITYGTKVVVRKNEVLMDGYKAVIGDATPDDMKANRMPEIFIVIADQVAIRKVKISGEVI